MTDRHGPAVFTAWLLGVAALGAALGLTLAINLTPPTPGTPRVTPISSITPTNPAAR